MWCMPVIIYFEIKVSIIYARLQQRPTSHVGVKELANYEIWDYNHKIKSC